MITGFIKAGLEPPRELPSHAVYVIEAKSDGPSAFKVDGMLDAAHAVYLFETGHPLDPRVSAAARQGVLVIIEAGASFRAWFRHLEQLGLLAKTLAQGISGDPRRLDS